MSTRSSTFATSEPGGGRGWCAGLCQVVASLWAGAQWAVGYLVAPTLFALLDDRREAGRIAGWMFERVNLLGLGCAALLVALLVARRRAAVTREFLLVVVVAMLALSLVLQFWIQPTMQALKLAGEAAGAAFATWHGVSSGLYLLQSLLAVVLVVGVQRRPPC
ncbi:MAG: DUF4149 domain-containing protein [Rhodocyclaceae bacterium]|nr:DUF4149 domain-containing protein [Rhodocyclaceae bacterium]